MPTRWRSRPSYFWAAHWVIASEGGDFSSWVWSGSQWRPSVAPTLPLREPLSGRVPFRESGEHSSHPEVSQFWRRRSTRRTELRPWVCGPVSPELPLPSAPFWVVGSFSRCHGDLSFLSTSPSPSPL